MLQIVGSYPFGLNDFESFQSLSRGLSSYSATTCRMDLRFAWVLPSWLRSSRFWWYRLAWFSRFSPLDRAWLQCSRPENFQIFFLMKSRYTGKDCSTEQEKCPSDFFKIFVRVGEKQRICGWPSDFNWNEFRLRLFRTWKLQAITILYIGGASSTSSLLTCQELDGNQDASATFWCNLMFFFRFWPLFDLWVFLSCSCPFAKQCMKECYVRRLTFLQSANTTSPNPIRSLELWIFLGVFSLSLSLYI